MAKFKRTDLAAFDERSREGDGQRRAIIRVIEAMEDKQVALSSDHFTSAELLDLFIDPKDHHVLTEAWNLVEPSGSTQELYAVVDRPAYANFNYTADGTLDSTPLPATMYLKFSWHKHNCADCFYVPYRQGARKDTAVRFRPEANRDLIDKFVTTCMDLCDVHWRFSQALMVFKRLNVPGVCRTPAQMRYVWPCLYRLCRKAGFDDLADEIEQADPRAGDKVRVPAYLYPMLRTTNETIAKTAFLDDIEPGPGNGIRYVLGHEFVRA
jgi:hypothetical protein